MVDAADSDDITITLHQSGKYDLTFQSFSLTVSTTNSETSRRISSKEKSLQGSEWRQIGPDRPLFWVTRVATAMGGRSAVAVVKFQEGRKREAAIPAGCWSDTRARPKIFCRKGPGAYSFCINPRP